MSHIYGILFSCFFSCFTHDMCQYLLWCRETVKRIFDPYFDKGRLVFGLFIHFGVFLIGIFSYRKSNTSEEQFLKKREGKK